MKTHYGKTAEALVLLLVSSVACTDAPTAVPTPRAQMMMRPAFNLGPGGVNLGFVLSPNNVSYGGNAGVTNKGVFFGELNFENHTNGDHIHMHDVTSYTHPTTGPLSEFAETRQIVGPVTLNGVEGYTVTFRATDLGEPGTNDRVWMQMTGPGGTSTLIGAMKVDGGNLQLHNACRGGPQN